MISFLSRISFCTEAMTKGSEILQTRCTTSYSSVTSISGEAICGAAAESSRESTLRAQQLQSVCLGLGQCLLVPEHGARGIFLDMAECDEAPALGCRLASRMPERLGIAIDR